MTSHTVSFNSSVLGRTVLNFLILRMGVENLQLSYIAAALNATVVERFGQDRGDV